MNSVWFLSSYISIAGESESESERHICGFFLVLLPLVSQLMVFCFTNRTNYFLLAKTLYKDCSC